MLAARLTTTLAWRRATCLASRSGVVSGASAPARSFAGHGHDAAHGHGDAHGHDAHLSPGAAAYAAQQPHLFGEEVRVEPAAAAHAATPARWRTRRVCYSRAAAFTLRAFCRLLPRGVTLPTLHPLTPHSRTGSASRARGRGRSSSPPRGSSCSSSRCSSGPRPAPTTGRARKRRSATEGARRRWRWRRWRRRR